MRKVEYQAWDSVNKEMGTVADISWHNHDEGFDIRVSGMSFDDCVHYNDIRQFTGRTDKKGIKIFEGDIVRAWVSMMDVVGVVIYDEQSASFMIQRNVEFEAQCKLFGFSLKGHYDDGRSSYDFDNSFLVIGNKFENPKLYGREV